MDTITIYEDGRPAGTLTLGREGLYTVLEAALPPAPGLTRLWLCGAGERADLGVMEPRPEGRRFCRRYTRTALAALPAPMEYALVLPTGDTAPAQAEQNVLAADPASFVPGERIATAPAGPRNDRKGEFPSSAPLTEGGGAERRGELKTPSSPRHCEAGAHTGCGNPQPPHQRIFHPPVRIHERGDFCMDTITIYEDGRPAGTLTLGREGLYTVLEAALPPAPGLTRLWLCGAGERADLGVMEPRPEGRRFCRRYTRTALAALPAPMEYAVVTSEETRTAPLPPCGESSAILLPSSFSSQTRSAGLCSDRERRPAASPRHCEAGAHTGCGNPRPSSPEIVKLKTETYLALPCQLRHPRPGLRIVTLDGRDYLLFRYCAKPPTGV